LVGSKEWSSFTPDVTEIPTINHQLPDYQLRTPTPPSQASQATRFIVLVRPIHSQQFLNPGHEPMAAVVESEGGNRGEP